MAFLVWWKRVLVDVVATSRGLYLLPHNTYQKSLGVSNLENLHLLGVTKIRFMPPDM